MTAGCSFPDGSAPRPADGYSGQPVQCSCPTWNGPYQVGQTFPDASTCEANRLGSSQGYVWSAVYTTTVLPASP